jgi:hypothetical protein
MTPLVRIAAWATAFSTVATGAALGQHSRGTMGVPWVAQQPAPVRPAPAPPSGRGTMSVPMRPGPTAPRGGDLPRIVTSPSRPTSGYGYRNPYGNGGGSYGNAAGYDSRDRGGRYEGSDRGGRYARRPYTTGSTTGYTTGYTPIGGYKHRALVCGFGCVRIGGGPRAARVFSTFAIGYPFYVPILVPYIYDATYVRYGEAAAESYAPETQTEFGRPASKLIVVGAGSAAGGDALTVETVGDSVRLSWLGAGRPAREVTLFVTDSAKRQLASRSASPSVPNATFEISTLSAPVAFAGVSVTFTDGVTSTTVVPYRAGTTPAPRR